MSIILRIRKVNNQKWASISSLMICTKIFIKRIKLLLSSTQSSLSCLSSGSLPFSSWHCLARSFKFSLSFSLPASLLDENIAKPLTNTATLICCQSVVDNVKIKPLRSFPGQIPPACLGNSAKHFIYFFQVYVNALSSGSRQISAFHACHFFPPDKT